MALTKWNPWSINSRSPLFWDEDWFRSGSDNTGIDVYETENEIVVEAALPGLTEEQVDVTYENGILRIQGSKQLTDEEKNGRRSVYKESGYTDFDYTTTLPRAVDADKIEAEVAHGIVKVKAPIAEASKPRKIKATGAKKTRKKDGQQS